MAINRVDYGNTTLIDLTDATATAAEILQGYTAYGKEGILLSGTASGGAEPDQYMTEGNWLFMIHEDNKGVYYPKWFTALYKATGQSFTITAQSGALYRSNLMTLTLPSYLTANYSCDIRHVEVNVSHNNYPTWGLLASLNADGFNYYVMSGGSRSTSPNYLVTAMVKGLATNTNVD